MTWPWHTSFKLAAALLLASMMPAATVAGNVELTNSKDPAVRKRRDYSGVVIWLEPLDRSAPVAPPRRTEMLQKDKQFSTARGGHLSGERGGFP